MRTLAELGWKQTWVRWLRQVAVGPEHVSSRTEDAAFLGAPRFGERSSAAVAERATSVDRRGVAARHGRPPGRPRGAKALILDQTMRRHFPYVAALLEELEELSLSRGSAAPASRRRAVR